MFTTAMATTITAAVTATWRNANETVPQPASLPPAATGGVPDANVLVDDYWDVYKVLLR